MADLAADHLPVTPALEAACRALGTTPKLADAALLRCARAGIRAERECSEALIAQAQDYASAESERADKLAVLALELENALQGMHRAANSADSRLAGWRMRREQLADAAGEMSPPDSDPLEDAYQAGVKDGRERIRQLAITNKATWLKPCDQDDHNRGLHTHHRRPFADLIEEETHAGK